MKTVLLWIHSVIRSVPIICFGLGIALGSAAMLCAEAYRDDIISELGEDSLMTLFVLGFASGVVPIASLLLSEISCPIIKRFDLRRMKRQTKEINNA